MLIMMIILVMMIIILVVIVMMTNHANNSNPYNVLYALRYTATTDWPPSPGRPSVSGASGV